MHSNKDKNIRISGQVRIFSSFLDFLEEEESKFRMKKSEYKPYGMSENLIYEKK